MAEPIALRNETLQNTMAGLGELTAEALALEVQVRDLAIRTFDLLSPLDRAHRARARRLSAANPLLDTLDRMVCDLQAARLEMPETAPDRWDR